MKTLNLAIATFAIVAAASSSAFAFGNAPGNGPQRDTNTATVVSSNDTYSAGKFVAPATSLSANDALVVNLQAQNDAHQSAR